MVKKQKRRRRAGTASSQTAEVAREGLEQQEVAVQVEQEPPAKISKKRKRTVAKPTDKKSFAPTPSVKVASSVSVVAKADHPSIVAPTVLSGTTSPSDWTALIAQLREGGAALEAVEVRHTGPVHGYGVFAKRDIHAGEVAFALAANQALTPELAQQDEMVSRVGTLLSNRGQHSELLMCLRLCRARVCAQDTLHLYVASLPLMAPGAPSWPEAFRVFLSATNLGRNLLAVDAELDTWMKLLQQVAESEPSLLRPKGAFERSCLEWARGMLHSRRSTLGDHDTAMCMVPLVDLLAHKPGAELALRVGDAGRLEAVSTASVKAGQQLHRDFGKLSNAELLLKHGFAMESNKWDFFPLSLSQSERINEDTDGRLIHVTAHGVPQDVIDAIEDKQDTEQFVAILRSLLLQKRSVKEHIRRLPVALNFNVCKGPLARARKRWIEAYLEGQLQVLEDCLDTLQTAEEDAEAGEAMGAMEEAENEEAENEEAEGESVDEAEIMDMLHKKKRRRTRRRG